MAMTAATWPENWCDRDGRPNKVFYACREIEKNLAFAAEMPMTKNLAIRWSGTLLAGMLAGASAQSSEVAVRPLTARPGETFTMVVSLGECVDKGSLDKDSLVLSGSDLTVKEAPDKAGCDLVYTVEVAAKPSNRVHTVLVRGKEKGPSLRTFQFDIVDIPPGPTPPGMNPGVDVMWDIMSEKNCADQFGNRVSRRYFCIDVMVGNNSGYPIILAAVGFMRPNLAGVPYRESAANYLSIRSVVQREQEIGGRNFSLRGLQAAGVMIAGFTPFSGNAGRRGRIGIWSTLVGTVAATAFDGLVPDQTVRQTHALDDAALRDGKLIANNSPAIFRVCRPRCDFALAAAIVRTIGGNGQGITRQRTKQIWCGQSQRRKDGERAHGTCPDSEGERCRASDKAAIQFSGATILGA